MSDRHVWEFTPEEWKVILRYYEWKAAVNERMKVESGGRG